MYDRLTDAIVDANKGYNIGGAPSPIIAGHRGGQNGYMPLPGIYEDGKLVDNLQNAQPYVKQNVIPLVLRYPYFFNYMPNKDLWVKAYKSFIEDSPQSITGLTSGASVETVETAVGGSGEMFQTPSDVKQERSTPTINIPDKANRSWQRFLNTYIRYGIKDPHTKTPLVTTYFDLKEDGYIYTNDMFSGVVIFIEPDVTQQYVVDCWLCLNFYPLKDGTREGRRDLTQAGELNELSIDFAAVTFNNEAVQLLGQKLLDKLTVRRIRPDTGIMPPVEDIHPDLESADTGYNKKY